MCQLTTNSTTKINAKLRKQTTSDPHCSLSCKCLQQLLLSTIGWRPQRTNRHKKKDRGRATGQSARQPQIGMPCGCIAMLIHAARAGSGARHSPSSNCDATNFSPAAYECFRCEQLQLVCRGQQAWTRPAEPPKNDSAPRRALFANSGGRARTEHSHPAPGRALKKPPICREHEIRDR